MHWRRLMHGSWLTLSCLIRPRGRRDVAAVIDGIYAAQQSALRAPEFVMLVGYSKTGKSTLRTGHPLLQQYVHLDDEEIFGQVNPRFQWATTDQSFFGPMYFPRRVVIMLALVRLLVRYFERRQPVVLDICIYTPMWRQLFFRLAQLFGYRRTIVHVHCDATEHLRRLRLADARRIASGLEPYFERNFLDIQVPRYVPPVAGEADWVVDYPSDRHQPGDVTLPNELEAARPVADPLPTL